MHRLQQFTLAGCLAASLTSAASAATIAIDNFESYDPTVLPYSNGIATSFNSTPWLRLGGGVADNMYASSVTSDGAASVLAGTHSGLVPVNLNSTGAQAIFMRNYGFGVDFSGTNTVTVLASSNSALPTNVQLLIFDAAIGDGGPNTSFISTTPVSLLGGNLAQTLTFSLAPTALDLSDPGSDNTPFADAVTHLYSIGFRFSSATGLNGGENIYLDNMVATSVVPEPASLAMLAVGGTLLGKRRRRA